MKRFLLFFLALPMLSVAQPKQLLIEGSAPALYVNHTVAPKENYYSIGRLYNISPKEIAPFNKLELEKGLSLGQVIKVPLTASNFIQSGEPAADEAAIPVYHTVKEKEGLYRISVNYNKVPLETLKQWNKLKTESVSNGTKLVVGYLKVKKELSAFAGGAKPVSVTPVSAPVANTTPVKQPSKPDISNETLPVVKNPEKQPVAIKEPVKTAPVKQDPVVVPEPVVKTAPVKEPVVQKEPATEPVKTNPPVVTSKIGRSFNGGLFRSEFDRQVKSGELVNESGWAAVFKSTSGWEDGKYYCLHNTANPGSIIKITNKTNGKTVYAKVLDVMPDIKQNSDLVIRLSNAAADELGATDVKFDCALSFSR